MLKTALYSNAAFSALSAISILSATTYLSSEIPLPNYLWLIIATGLGCFAAQLLVMAINEGLASKLTPQVIAADLAWIAISGVAMLVFLGEISSAGITIIMAINCVVACLAWFQFKGYRELVAD